MNCMKRIGRYIVIPHWPHHQLPAATILILVDNEMRDATDEIAVSCRCIVQAWLSGSGSAIK